MLVLAATNVGATQSVSLLPSLSVSVCQLLAASHQCGNCDSSSSVTLINEDQQIHFAVKTNG